MKKQINLTFPSGRKLDINKRTISNLNALQMDSQVGGARTNGKNCVYTNHHSCFGSCGPTRCD